MSLAINILTRSRGGLVTGGGGGGGSSADLVYGINLGSDFYFNAMPIFVDLFKQGAGVINAAGDAYAAVDVNGWPDEDFFFGLQRLPPDQPFSQSVTVLVDGNPGTVSMRLANFWTLGAVTYDAGTDTATIGLTTPDRFDIAFEGCQLRFTGTKKTPGSATGSGVRRVRVPRPGYAAKPDQVVSDEFKAIMAGFNAFRFVKVTGGENDISVTSWAQYPRRASVKGRQYGGEDAGLMPVEDMLAICNECNASPWLNINGGSDPTLGTASVEGGLAAYFEANLNSGLNVCYEFVNETWNFGYRWFGFGNDKMAAELHGFWHDSYDRMGLWLKSASRSSGVVTLETNVPHGVTTGETYRCVFEGKVGTVDVTTTRIDATHFSIPDAGTDCKFTPLLGQHFSETDGDPNHGGDRVSGVVTARCRDPHNLTTGDSVYVGLNGLTLTTKIFTVTVTDAKHFTFPDAGADTALSLTNSGNSWGASLSVSSTLLFDGDPSIYGEKWFARRRVQMSDNIKAAVPTDKFMTRHRPVYMSQLASGTLWRLYDAKAMIETGLGSTFKDKFYAIGGGCYPDGTDSTGARIVQDTNNAHTKAEFLTAYADGTLHGRHDSGATSSFDIDIFSSFALSEGVQHYIYEVGVDTRIYSNGAFRAANGATLRDAVNDNAWKPIETNFFALLRQNGVTWMNTFNGEMTAKTDTSGAGYWSVAWGIRTASPKQQAYNEWGASIPAVTKNLAPGSVDARLPIMFYEGTGGGTTFNFDGSLWPTMNAPWVPYPMSGNRWRYIVNASATGASLLTISFKTLAAVPHTITVIHNGVSLGTVTVASAGVGNMGSSSSISVPLVKGPNGIDLLRDAANADFEIHAMNFA